MVDPRGDVEREESILHFRPKWANADKGRVNNSGKVKDVICISPPAAASRSRARRC